MDTYHYTVFNTTLAFLSILKVTNCCCVESWKVWAASTGFAGFLLIDFVLIFCLGKISQ